MRNGRIMLVVAAAVLCLSGLAGAATSISFLTTYDDDGNTATAMVTKQSGTYLWFDPNNWYGGTPPQFEGESAALSTWELAAGTTRIMDLAGGIVDLVGRNYDPGTITLTRIRGGTFTFVDSSVDKTSYFKTDTFQVQQWTNVFNEVPIITDKLVLTYRGCDFTTSGGLDANTVSVGEGHLTINAPPTGQVKAKRIDMVVDNGMAEFYVPSVTINAPVSNLTTVTMSDQMWGQYDANGDGAIGTGTVNIQSGTMTVRKAQTTFPTVTLGANCNLAGNLTGATYGALGKVQFQAGSILGDTVGSNDPNRAQAGGATLYKPVATISTGTITSGDDGTTAYKGIGIGPWSDSNSVGGTIQARAGSGDLNIAIANTNMYLDANSTFRGDGTSKTANIKIFPGNGRITLANGGINGNASGADLITTFNIDGVAGDKSPAADRIASDEKWTILKSSGTGAILPGQTVKITNGVYMMDTYNAVNTVGGKLIIGAGGALDIRDSNSVPNGTTGNYNRRGTPVQFSATGSLEVQNRGLLKLPDGNSLGAVGADASRVTVSGTPIVMFNRSDSGYFAEWNAEVTIDAAANPGLQKILDQANIILHNCYRASDTKRRTKFMGDGLRIREGGVVSPTWTVDTSNTAECGVRADSTYFGPADNGGSFTLAAGVVGLQIGCPVGNAIKQAGTININSTDPIETVVNTGWYPYQVSLGRVVGVPTGSVTVAGMVYANNIIVRNGALTLSGGTTGTTEIRHDSTTGDLTMSGVTADVDKIIINSRSATISSGTSGTQEIIHNSTTGNLTISTKPVDVRKIVVNSGNFTLSSGTTNTSQSITFNSTGTMALSGPAIDAPYVYVNAGTCNASGGTIDNLGMHIISHGIVNVSDDFGSGSVTAASDGYVNLNNTVLAIKDVTVNSQYVNGSRGLKVNHATNTVVSGRLSGTGSWGQCTYIQMSPTATIAPGGNSVGSINDGGTGLWLQDNATIEWQIKDPKKGPGDGWDVIYGTTFDFDTNNDNAGTLNFNILDGGLTKDIVATDKFPVVIIQGAGAIDIPGDNPVNPSLWTQNITAPAGWDKTGASLYYDTVNKTLYLTGLVVRFTVPGDTNGDKVVDAADFITLKKNFGRTDALDAQNGNFTTGDTNVNWADLSVLMNNMGPGSTPATAPEPCSAILLVFGAAALLRRRRKA